MGMFDDIRCDVTLPDGKSGDAGFQTKDLDCTLDEFVITETGRLIKQSKNADPHDDVDVNYDGDLVFYTDYPDGWRQFRATFRSGQLIEITQDGS